MAQLTKEELQTQLKAIMEAEQKEAQKVDIRLQDAATRLSQVVGHEVTPSDSHWKAIIHLEALLHDAGLVKDQE